VPGREMGVSGITKRGDREEEFGCRGGGGGCAGWWWGEGEF